MTLDADRTRIPDRSDPHHGAADLAAREPELMSATGIGVLRWASGDDRLAVSAASRRLLGLAAEGAPATLGDWVGLVQSEDREAYRRALEHAAATGIPYRLEFRIVRPVDGQLVWVEERGGVVTEPTGTGGPVVQALHWQSAPCARLSDDYDRLIDRLRRADASKDEFLAMLAHELRNPLAPLRNAARLLSRLGRDEPRLVEIAAIVGRQAEHMASLLGDLLDVGRIVRGTIDVDCKPTDLAAAVREAVEQTRRLIEARGHALAVVLDPPSGLWVLGDHVRLVQMVANLLANAAKYTPDGGRIEVTGVRDTGAVSLRVADTGIGIDAALLPHVFETFTQATRSIDRRQGGLGLGLAIVHGLVDMHGGFIEAASDGPGCGSRFTVRLPALAEPPPQAAELQRPH